MNNLGGLLEKFVRLIGTSKFEKDAVISTVRSVTGISLTDADVTVKDFVIDIKARPAVRGVLFMHKQKILNELQKNLGTKAPRNIR